MIELTKYSGSLFYLNCELIESVEEKPDTTITLFNGRKYIVKERSEEIFKKIIEFKRKAYDIHGSTARYVEELKNKTDKNNDECESC